MAPIQKNRIYNFAEVLKLPYNKADAELERIEFIGTCARAEAKGNRALELLRTIPAGKYGDAKAEDYAAPSNLFRDQGHHDL